MRGPTLQHLLLLPALLRPYVLANPSTPEIHDDDNGLFSFESRPDIRAPEWEIEVYDEAALAPGYWFFGPYETLNMDDSIGNGWIGPHIYAQDGTLIWSGAPLFDNGNIEDFRISNVDGKDMMTVMDQRHSEGVFIDNDFQIRYRRKANGPVQHTFNSHEFHFVDNGTKALVVWSKDHDYPEAETAEALGLDAECRVHCDGIQEWDVKTWTTGWHWSSCDHIGLEESTYKTDFLAKQCGGRWDYVHANSIDKTPEGDYIFSGRHTNAIYKISKDDGSIIWRLGGVQSDFEQKDDFVFSRQHDIRYRGRNETHTFVSFLDNAKGLDKDGPTHPFSRGLLIALDEEDMKAEIAAHYDHPDGDGGLAFRRGNYQPLSNGNVFMCWSERALQSEHSADGKMLMQAKLKVEWLGTYRGYKFDFVGMPADPPDMVGGAVAVKGFGGTETSVHVSWNGATEVHSWNLYKTTKHSSPRVLVSNVAKSGFETKLTYNGFAQHVIAEAVAKDGTVLGQSKRMEIDTPQDSTPAIEDELAWQRDPHNQPPWYQRPFAVVGATIIAACAVVSGVYACFRSRYSRNSKGATSGPRRPFRIMDILSRGRYARLGDSEKELQDREGGKPLMNGRSRRRSDDDWDGGDFRDGEGEAFVVGDEEDEQEGFVGKGKEKAVDLEDLEREEGVGLGVSVGRR